MANVKLTLASGLYDRMLPLYTGDVKPEGIDLTFERIDEPRVIFDRLSGEGAFDVAEFSSSEFIARHMLGDREFVALPVFPSRVFRHGLITINKKSGVRVPKDLEGRRVGVPLYTMTAAIWIKGHFQHQFGCDISKISWVQGAINGAGGHGHPTLMPLVKPVDITNKPDGVSLGDMLERGEIDAIIGTSLPDCIKTNPDIVRMFPNYKEIEKELWIKDRIWPIMHLIAIRRKVWEANPFIAQSLYTALTESKDMALASMKKLQALRYMLPWLPADLDEIEELFDGDPWPHGVEANRPTLTAMVQYLHEQHLIERTVPVDELFVDVK
ncbi:MAG: hypothetical protein NWT00_00275 [Beijerinckiaceae bacterium]|jgi:4,5-dihydroxyphthalate decarboxylase|nr:hypothetical protein [Beijerinckiaceae bacterium]